MVNGHRAGAASAEDTYDIAIDIYSSPSTKIIIIIAVVTSTPNERRYYTRNRVAVISSAFITLWPTIIIIQ